MGYKKSNKFDIVIESPYFGSWSRRLTPNLHKNLGRQLAMLRRDGYPYEVYHDSSKGYKFIKAWSYKTRTIKRKLTQFDVR